MKQLIYVSTATSAFDPATLEALGEASSARNRSAGLSGILLFDGLRFLQLIEGPEGALDATLARIHRDPRHRSLVVLSERAIIERSFPQWAMVGRSVPGTDLLAELAPLLKNASASTRALFESFAKIRAAA